ncbi:MAG TPA: prepilin peptidase [Dehalococcoidia bacterium]|jgi:leader peptidase (prepilin peptidase)/N-methyltransferase|nr:prepilin peptidase [Dehalococcoidia bacterium]
MAVELGILGFYSSVLVLLGVIDFKYGIIPNRLVYPAMLLAIGIALCWPGMGITDSIIGGCMALGLLLLPALVSKGGMGWGDVKMATLIGLMTGFPLVFIALLIAAGLAASVLLGLRLRGRKGGIPFGPFLSLGALTTLLWGHSL